MTRLLRLLRTCLFATACLLASCFETKSAAQDKSQTTFGHRQIQQLISDRPSMDNIVNDTNELYKYLLEKFNSGAQGERIHWDERYPSSRRPAEHQPARPESLAHIRITNSADVSGRDKWCMLVFEMENIQNTDQFRKLHQRAISGDISSGEYCKECIHLEFRALLRTKQILLRYPIAGATDERDPIFRNVTQLVDDFELYFRWVRLPQNSDYIKYYAAMYESYRAYGNGPPNERDHGKSGTREMVWDVEDSE